MTGTRYSLKIDGALFDPSDLNDCGAYNPGGLKSGVWKVAAHVALALDTEVEVIKHLKSGDRVEGYFVKGWNC